MSQPIHLSFTVRATPSAVYNAWLNGDQHAAMTGGAATGSPEVGAGFTAWDGYIWGTNLELEANARIVQSWSTAEFAEHDAPSRLEVRLMAVEGGTEISLTHSQLPEGTEEKYTEGWQEFYVTPLSAFFGA